MSAWRLVAAGPLAWGGWQFNLDGPAGRKQLEWWPGDAHLSCGQRPFLAAPIARDDSKSARAAVAQLVIRLNEMEAADA